MNRYIKAILIVTFLFVNIQFLSAYEIQKMCKQVYINQDGSANVEVNVKFSTTDKESLLQLPMIFGVVTIDNANLDSNTEELAVKVINNDIFNYVEIPFQVEVGNHHLYMAYTVKNYIDWDKAGPGEFNSYEFSTSVENTFLTAIDTFTLCTILPEGWNYHKIIGSAPAFKSKDPNPPYVLDEKNGRFCATISRTPMQYREKVALEFIFKHTKKSYSIVFVGLILMGLYLFFFRNLIVHKGKNNLIKEDNNNKGETDAK